MNAFELFNQDGSLAHLYCCSLCRHVSEFKTTADMCCCLCGCGKKKKTGYTECLDCHQERIAEAKLAKFNVATKIQEKDYTGYVYAQGIDNDYFASMQDLHEYLEDQSIPIADYPEYVWACEKIKFAHASLDNTIKDIEQAYENFETDDLNGLDELQLALDKFNEANKEMCSYTPDFTMAVLLEKRKELKQNNL
jgi:hypothetical protein